MTPQSHEASGTSHVRIYTFTFLGLATLAARRNFTAAGVRPSRFARKRRIGRSPEAGEPLDDIPPAPALLP